MNGRGRDVILEDMRRRIDRGNIDMEVAETIKVRTPPASFRTSRSRYSSRLIDTASSRPCVILLQTESGNFRVSTWQWQTETDKAKARENM